MQSIRRSVFRAVTSSSVVKPRCITTTSNQFLLRSNRPVATTQILNFRRWSSDEAVKSEEENQVEREMEQAEEASSDNSFSDSISKAASSISNAAESAVESVTDAASSFTDRRADAPENAGIYVGNLSFEVTPDELEREFKAFGNVQNVRLATDARGLSKGFGYVTFDTVESAKAAIEAKDQSIFEGRRMIVNYQIQNPNRVKQESVPSKTLFIGNLAFEMSDADLNKLFREIKNVVDVRVAIDRRTGQPRGFAHADFIDVESAEKGKEYLQDKEVYGRQLRVDFSGQARERTSSPRDGSYGGRDSGRGGARGGRGGSYGGRGGDRGGSYGGDRGGDRY